MDKHGELPQGYDMRPWDYTGELFTEGQMREQATRLRAEWEREQLTWKEAVLNELIVCHIYNSSHDNDPRKAMQDAITCNCQIALDPTVSSEAQALIDRGAVESRAEIEAKALEEAAKEIGHCWRCKADDTLNGMAADRRVIREARAAIAALAAGGAESGGAE